MVFLFDCDLCYQWVVIRSKHQVVTSLPKKSLRLFNRPLALRGHVTKASFKQWVGILLMPKIHRAHKNYFTPQIWEGDILWHFDFCNKVVWFVLDAILEGILLPSNMVAKTTFCLYLVNHMIVMLRFAVTDTTSSLQHFPWSLHAKFVLRKR